jgi:hypothetical protein
MKFLDVCDELSNECSLDKDQVLSMWVALSQKWFFFLYFAKVFLWWTIVVWGLFYNLSMC